MRPEDSEHIATRSSLLERLKDLDNKAGWSQFFDAYWKLLYCVALRAGLKPHAAEDVVQDTVVSVAREIGGFEYDRRQGTFKGWLYTVLRRRIADHYRKEKRHLPVSDGLNGAIDAAALPDSNGVDLERIWSEEWATNLVSTALGRVRHRISDRDYQIFHCITIQGWTVLQTCRQLQLNPAQVYVAKHRVGKCLKTEIQKLQNGD